MAEVFVINSLNTTKSVKFNIGMRYFVVKGDQDGDNKWILEIGTTHSGSAGETSLAKRIHGINAEDLDQVMEDAISELCGRIDWQPMVSDRRPPIAEELSPQGENIPIGSIISFRIKDDLPSAGIDLTNMSVILNNSVIDFDITNELEIVGDPYEYYIKWIPPRS